MKIYLVGGAVRDILLGKAPKDKDYVITGTTPKQMLDLGYEQVGNDFPVFLHPETKDEYALARTERKTGSGYNDFECFFDINVTLEEDLLRRDLTINAMALDDKTKKIFDPYNGRQDLNNKTLRQVNSETFKEDPVRILRVARFQARMPDFTLHPELKNLLIDMVNEGMLQNLTKERIWKELSRAMTEKAPNLFFETLDTIGGLKDLFPIIHKMKGIPQRPDYHAEGDVFIHTMMVLKEGAKLTEKDTDYHKLLVAMANTSHDFGKTETKHDLLYDENGNPTGFHYGHDEAVVCNRLVEEFAKSVSMPSHIETFCKIIARNHQLIHGIKHLRAGRIAEFFNEINLKSKANKDITDQEYLRNIILACKSDAFGRKITVDGVIKDAPRDYSQQEIILLNSYEAYKNSSKEIKGYIEKYEIRNNKKATGELISQQLHQIRVKNIKQKIKPKP